MNRPKLIQLFVFSLFLIANGQSAIAQSHNTGEDELSIYQLALKLTDEKRSRKADSVLNLLGIPALVEKQSTLAADIMELKGTLKYNLYEADSSVYYYEKAIQKFRDLGKDEKVKRLYQRIVEPYMRARRPDVAFYTIQMAIDIDSLSENNKDLVRDLRIKADIFVKIGYTDAALTTLNRAFKVADDAQDFDGMRRVLTNIGQVNFNVGEYETAEEYYLRSQKIANNADVVLNWRKTNLYYRWEKYDIADSVNNVAQQDCDSAETPAMYGILLLQAGRIALAQEELDKARRLSNRALTITSFNRPTNGLAKNYLLKARIETAAENLEEANFWIDSALYFGEQVYDPLVRIRLYHQKSLIALLNNDDPTYHLYQTKYNGVKDSISGVDQVKAALAYELELAHTEMETQVSHLSTELEDTKERSNTTILAIVLCSLGGILGLVALIVGMRKRNRAKKIELSTENEALSNELESTKEAIEKIKETGTTPLEELPSHFEPLSKREKEVFEELVQGLSDKEIAKKLFISLPTVRTHIRHIYEKFHINSRMEAKDISLKYKV